jgi:hypothetical protein
VKSKLRILVLIGCCVVIGFAGCRKRATRPDSASAPGSAQPAPEVVPAQSTTPAGEPATSTAPASKYATPEDIAAYNKALYEYCYRVSDIPTDLEDLKRRRGLPPLPVPPPGRRLSYRPDLKTMEIRTAVVRLE